MADDLKARSVEDRERLGIMQRIDGVKQTGPHVRRNGPEVCACGLRWTWLTMAATGERCCYACLMGRLADAERLAEATGDALGRYAREVIGDNPEDVAAGRAILDAAIEAETKKLE